MRDDNKGSGGAADSAGQPQRASVISPPPRRRLTSPGADIDPDVRPPVEHSGRKPQSGVKAKPSKHHEKRQPTGDYAVGYARPPVEHQFNGKAGPGRPSGSLSHDTILRRNLAQSRKVKIDGKVKAMPMREYLVMTQIKLAAEGKLAALKGLLAESARLYPEPTDAQPEAAKAHPLGDGTSDGHILRELIGMLSIGEPNPESSDPWSDVAVMGGDEDGVTSPVGTWAEGDWGAEDPDQPEAEEDPDAQE